MHNYKYTFSTLPLCLNSASIFFAVERFLISYIPFVNSCCVSWAIGVLSLKSFSVTIFKIFPFHFLWMTETNLCLLIYLLSVCPTTMMSPWEKSCCAICSCNLSIHTPGTKGTLIHFLIEWTHMNKFDPTFHLIFPLVFSTFMA